MTRPETGVGEEDRPTITRKRGAIMEGEGEDITDIPFK